MKTTALEDKLNASVRCLIEYGVGEKHLLGIFHGRKLSDGTEFNAPIKTIAQLVDFIAEQEHSCCLPIIDGVGEVRNQDLWKALVLYLAGHSVDDKWNENPTH